MARRSEAVILTVAGVNVPMNPRNVPVAILQENRIAIDDGVDGFQHFTQTTGLTI